MLAILLIFTLSYQEVPKTNKERLEALILTLDSVQLDIDSIKIRHVEDTLWIR